MVHTLDRASLKAQCRELLQTAQVSPKGLTALYCGLSLVLNLVDYAAGSFASNGGPELLSMFASVFTMLAGWILATGFALYCMGIRQREIMDYGTLFDGFSFTGKIIALNFVMNFFICLWSMLFMIPGVIAYYRYRFALYNLCENPGLSVMEALDMSKRQEIYTERGERVRSKSEKIIADKLFLQNIPYHYERPIYLKGFGMVYPDFCCLLYTLLPLAY